MLKTVQTADERGTQSDHLLAYGKVNVPASETTQVPDDSGHAVAAVPAPGGTSSARIWRFTGVLNPSRHYPGSFSAGSGTGWWCDRLQSSRQRVRHGATGIYWSADPLLIGIDRDGCYTRCGGRRSVLTSHCGRSPTCRAGGRFCAYPDNGPSAPERSGCPVVAVPGQAAWLHARSGQVDLLIANTGLNAVEGDS